MGLDRVRYVLREQGVEPAAWKPRVRVAVVALAPDYAGYAAKVQDRLIEAGDVEAALYVEPRLSKLIPRLLEQGYTHLIVIGEREAREGKVTVRNLLKREQQAVELDALPSSLD